MSDTRGQVQRLAVVVDDYEALRTSHATTLQGAGFDARGLSFEQAMAMSDRDLVVLDLVVLDLHDARSNAERAEEADLAGVANMLPWHDRVAGLRVLSRLEDLAVAGHRVPRVVVASAVMQVEADLTERTYEFTVVSGAFCTIGVATEDAWLEKVRNAMLVRPAQTAVHRWWQTVPNWRSYRALVRTVDHHSEALHLVLEQGGRPTRPQQRELDRLNAEVGAVHEWRGALRGLLRKIFGWDLPHA